MSLDSRIRSAPAELPGRRAPPLTAGRRACAGGLLLGAGVALVRPDPFGARWAEVLLLVAAFVVLPLGLELVAGETRSPRAARILRLGAALQFPSAVLLAAAFLAGRGSPAAALALPWLAVTSLVALSGLVELRVAGPPTLSRAVSLAGQVFLAVGGAWTVCDRLGFRPLGFDAVIVLLTGIHFHYAGFALPLATALALGERPGAPARFAALAVISGVPLVAMGITASQVGWNPFPESLAAWILAAGGAASAWLHLSLALESGRSGAARALFGLAGLALGASMLLAAAYGSRFQFSLRWLDIPRMRVLHGTTNALGFGVAGLSGWWLTRRRSFRA